MSDAQIWATRGPIRLESLGLPAEIPALTLLGIGDRGTLVTDPSIRPKGPVSEVFFQKIRGQNTGARPAGEVEESRRTRFDLRGRVTEEIESRFQKETVTTYRYEGDRVTSMETSGASVRMIKLRVGSYWEYNAQGKLAEFRQERDGKTERRESGFRYDEQGRLLGYEDHEDGGEKPLYRVNIRYLADGKTILVSKEWPGNGGSVDRETRSLDDRGRVIQVFFESEGGKADSGDAKNVFFRYDEQGRVVEQRTDWKQIREEAGAEQELPPGAITIRYDDQRHTRTTKYVSPRGGEMAATVTQDSDGSTLGFQLDTNMGISAAEKFQCEYDQAGNWIHCQQTFLRDRKWTVGDVFRRTITYR